MTYIRIASSKHLIQVYIYAINQCLLQLMMTYTGNIWLILDAWYGYIFIPLFSVYYGWWWVHAATDDDLHRKYMTYIRHVIWVYIYTIIKWVLWLMIIYIRTPIAHRTSLTLHNSANFNKPGLKEWRNRFHGGITKTLPHLYYRVISFYYRHSWWFLMGRENLEYGLLIAYNSLMEFCLIYITNFVIDVIYNLLHFCYKLLVKLLGRPFYLYYFFSYHAPKFQKIFRADPEI